MFKRLLKALASLYKKRQKKVRNSPAEPVSKPIISGNLDENIRYIKTSLGNSPDLIIRKFGIGIKQQIMCAVVHIDGMADKNIISQNVLKNLMIDARLTPPGINKIQGNAFRWIRDSVVSLSEVKEATELKDVLDAVLSGDTVLMVDGTARALIVCTRRWESRAIEEPSAEPSVRGPRDGFTEVLKTNITLIRRRIKSPRLRLEQVKIGEITGTNVVIVYIKGVADDKVVEEVRRRISKICVDGILESGYIEELIEDCPISPFSTIGHTERPDKVAAQLLEGKVAILCDNTPFALTVPALFNEFLQAPEDYYERYFIGSFTRGLRYISMFASLTLPAVWVSIITFHQELIPTPLLLSVAAAREGIPLPAVGEVLLMEFAFEVLREAGVRLPRPVGGAISIVGGIVIGEAAVQAGIVSAPVVIIVAFTGIASYAVAVYPLSITLRLLRFPLIAAGSVLGLYGVMLGLIMIHIHLASLRSFGVPFLSPISTGTISDFKDVFVRGPWWMMFKRPQFIGGKNTVRQKRELKPRPPRNTDNK